MNPFLMPIQYEDEEMTISDHLEILRNCLIVSLISVFIGTGIVWSWSESFLTWMARPVGELIFLAPTEAFFTRMKVALFGGFLLALPVVLHQVWTFVACALGPDTRRSVSFVLPVSYLLFIAGVSLAVLFVVPNAIHFLVAYGSESIRPQLAVGAYLEFVTMLALAFGIVFQIPLVLLFLHKAGLVTYESLADKRRYIYFGGVVLAAVLTPGPDVISQIALAIPIIILFEISLLVMRTSK